MKVKFKKLNEEAIIPEFKTAGSAGMDITSIEDVTLNPGQFKIVKTGLACAIEEGYEVQIRPRSGMACKYGITVINTPGTIDSDYRGELKIILASLTDVPFTINKGDRIAQMVFAKVEKASFEEVDTLSDTQRGEGGFGSTNK